VFTEYNPLSPMQFENLNLVGLAAVHFELH
jgi:hypothetical protein